MDEVYSHWLRRFVMTAGVVAEADANGSHWLADIAASYQPYPHVRCEEFQCWTLKVNADRTAVVTMDDGNGNVRVRQEVPWTDHPEPGTTWWLVGSGGQTPVLMKPEEY